MGLEYFLVSVLNVCVYRFKRVHFSSSKLVWLSVLARMTPVKIC